MVPQMKRLPWYILKVERKREKEDDMIYETIRLLTPKTLSSAAHVPLLPLHYMLQAPWRPRDRRTKEEEKDRGIRYRERSGMTRLIERLRYVMHY